LVFCNALNDERYQSVLKINGSQVAKVHITSAPGELINSQIGENTGGFLPVESCASLAGPEFFVASRY
jgi:hypothetical protein